MSLHTAIGMIEAYGLAAAIEAGDAALKAANVRLLGCDFSQGNGWVAVKVAGDVGAVQAAVAAGTAAAQKLNQVIGTLIMPRPHSGVEQFLVPPPAPPVELPPAEESAHAPEQVQEASQSEPLQEAQTELRPTCNLCRDPGCPRRKGQPHGLCIHNGGEKEG